MTFWQQRNLHYTKGWGPCKRTKVVPLSEHFARQYPDGMTRVWDRRWSIDPGVFGPSGGYHGPSNMGHLGYFERGPGGVGTVVPRDGGDPWNNHGVNELLDDVFAARRQADEDRRVGDDRRAQTHRDTITEINERIDAINGRFRGHVDTYNNRLDGPVSDAHLNMLRAESDVYTDRARQRANAESRRDWQSLRALHMATIGEQTARDMKTHGFVPVNPVWRGHR